ncbi:MAG: AsmA-like C-terminal region-containing protein [Crocinitomicaceae bacterium]|nr:AsmA-like C-terminal region-containing protein [Crocinitomicaceae bacterium]
MNKEKVIKIAKWFFGILIGLFLLISAAIAIFKDDIINYVVVSVNKSLNAKVSVSKIDLTFWRTFPNLSVDFNDVLISDSLNSVQRTDTVLFSELIQLKFNPMDIWSGKYELKKVAIHPGTIQLRVDQNGRENYNIIKKSEEESESKFNLKLEKVTFEDIRFVYANQVTGQGYTSKIKKLQLKGEFDDKQFTLAAQSDLFVNEIKSEQVVLLKNKPASFDIEIEVDSEKGTFEIPNATILISKLPFQLKGKVNPGELYFNISAKQLKLQEVASKLSNQLDDIQKLDGQGYFNFNLVLQSDNQKNSQLAVNCNFDIRNGSLREPSQNLKFTDIFLNGQFSNHAGKGKEFIKISDLRFNTISGPFQGEFLLTDFAKPHYVGKAKGNVDLRSIHALFHIPYIDQINGDLGLTGQFDLMTNIDAAGESSIQILKANALMNMKEINVSVINDTRAFKSLNGNLSLDGNEAALQDIRVVIGQSDFQLNGFFQNIAAYVSKKGVLNANVDLQSKFINAKDLSSESVSEKVDIQAERTFILPDDIEGVALLNIGQLKYEAHTFNQLQSNLRIAKRTLTFDQLSLQNAGAFIQGNAEIKEIKPEILLISTNVSSNNIYFKNLFKEWNNFDQKIITEDNISGKAHIDLTFQAPFDMRSGIEKNGILSKVYIKIEDGALKNVSTFKSITESLKTSSAKLVLGKRNIDAMENKLLDLRFDVLENTIMIRNGRIEIPAMMIKSNALDINVSGWHTFENQIDYHFVFRLRDLKLYDKDSEFGIVEDDGTGIKIFMLMSGTTDVPIIKWDETAKKEQSKENREAAKRDAKSILKSEFGIKKGDTSIQRYQPTKSGPKEELKIDFGEPKNTPDVDQKKESEMKRKMKEKMNKLKNSAGKEGVEFEVN